MRPASPRALPALCAVALALGACEEPLESKEERVIHILVEGGECEDPTPAPTAPLAAAPSPSPAPSATPGAAVAAAADVPLAPVPKTVLPEGAEEKRFAVLSKLRSVATVLDRKEMDYHDVPSVADPMKKAFDLLPKGEFAEAMFHAETAEEAAREATLNLDVVDRRLRRVQKRLEEAAPKLAGRGPLLEKEWQGAQSLVAGNHLVLANQKLESIEDAIDEAESVAQAAPPVVE